MSNVAKQMIVSPGAPNPNHGFEKVSLYNADGSEFKGGSGMVHLLRQQYQDPGAWNAGYDAGMLKVGQMQFTEEPGGSDYPTPGLGDNFGLYWIGEGGQDDPNTGGLVWPTLFSDYGPGFILGTAYFNLAPSVAGTAGLADGFHFEIDVANLNYTPPVNFRYIRQDFPHRGGTGYQGYGTSAQVLVGPGWADAEVGCQAYLGQSGGAVTFGIWSFEFDLFYVPTGGSPSAYTSTH